MVVVKIMVILLIVMLLILKVMCFLVVPKNATGARKAKYQILATLMTGFLMIGLLFGSMAVDPDIWFKVIKMLA